MDPDCARQRFVRPRRTAPHSGSLPQDQLDRQGYACPILTAGVLVQEKSDGAPAHLFEWQADGRKAGRHFHGEWNVVEPDNGQIAWNREAAVLDRLHGADGEVVTGREDGGRRFW